MAAQLGDRLASHSAAGVRPPQRAPIRYSCDAHFSHIDDQQLTFYGLCNKWTRGGLVQMHATSDASPQPFTAPSDPLVQKQVDKAAEVLQDILEDISRELFVSNAVADITRDMPEVTEQKAISVAVEKRLEGLDEFFMAALDGFVQAAQQESEPDFAEQLRAVQAEVLAQAAARLPPELRLLDAVQRMPDSEERVAALKQGCSTGGWGGLPLCELGSLLMAVTQLIDDMEDKQAVPDRRLLARLCLVREELGVAAADMGADVEGAKRFDEARSTYQRLLPQGAAAFVKELLAVSQPDRRQAILRRALDGGLGDAGGSSDGQARGAAAVRPGQLLTCLSAMAGELARQGRDSDALTLKRLEAIRLAALQALQDSAYGAGPA